jgi:hypothetical protein
VVSYQSCIALLDTTTQGLSSRAPPPFDFAFWACWIPFGIAKGSSIVPCCVHLHALGVRFVWLLADPDREGPVENVLRQILVCKSTIGWVIKAGFPGF